MIELVDKETGERLETISERQLQFMIDQLEEESLQDQEYYINRDTLDMFTEAGADRELVVALEKALGEREEMEISWRKV